MAVSPDVLPVRCRLCQAILPGWLRLPDSPHSALLQHHLGAMHRDEFRPYLVVHLQPADHSTSTKTRYNSPFHHRCGGAISWYRPYLSAQ